MPFSDDPKRNMAGSPAKGRGAVSDKSRPAFLITIDTEGDNIWRRPNRITTENTLFLPRFQ